MNIRFSSCGLLLLIIGALLFIGCAGSGGGGGDIIPVGGTAGGLTAGGTTAGATTGNSAAPSISATSPANGAVTVPTSSAISVTFSKAMDPATINAGSFRASTAGGSLPGTVTFIGNTATFKPTSALPSNTVVSASVTTAAKDPAGASLARGYGWSFTTGATSDTTAPTVSSTDPRNGATGVAPNKKIEVVFSKPIDASTINTNTFKLQGPLGAIAGSVTLLNNVAIFSPTNSLSGVSTYTATISTGVEDLSGNALASGTSWSFTTSSTADTTAPIAVSTDPGASATSVPTNQNVSVTFSEAMDVASLNASTFTLRQSDGTVVPAAVSYANKVAVLNPTSLLIANKVYTASVTTGAKDTAGNGLSANHSWIFTTAAATNTTAPTVISTNPANLATNVFINKSVNATFSEAMLPTSLNTSTFTVNGVQGTVSYDTANKIATFVPSSNFAPNTTYTAQIEVGAQSSDGVGLAARKVWTFTTGTQQAQTTINLGSATSYAVLAGSTVTNGGPTIINGDLGVSPGSAVTGFPPGLVNGSMHAGDAQAAQAKADLLVAQLDAAGRLGGATLPGDLSGLTFTPGLYKNSSSVVLSSGNVTLDAQGDANAVFVFQMASTLTTSTGTQVVLAGGAKAENIYWSVGSSATLGVNSIFKGIILAEVSITVNNGAVHDGTLLTKTGAVTLQANTVTRTSHKL